MDREGFRNRMKQYKKAREENPGLKYYDFMERLAEFKAKEWNDDPDMVLQHMLNDNSYNYRQMYEDDPNFDMQEGHFVDTYKTVYHPTFSEESMYSGKKSQYNPEGIVGGSWDESSKSFYLNDKRLSKRKAQDYLNHADPGYRAIPKYDEGTEGVLESYYKPETVEGIIAKTAVLLADPTGISSYPDVFYSGRELWNQPSWDKAGDFGLNIISALPLIGKVTAPFKAAKMGKLLARVEDANALVKGVEQAHRVNRVIDTVPEMIPVIRHAAEKTLDVTSALITDPLFNLWSSANKMDKVRDYRNANAAVDAINISNNTADIGLGIGELQKFAGGGEVGEKKAVPTQEEYIAEQIAARKAAALKKSLSRTMPRVPQGIKTGERWNPVTKKVENIYECGPSCAYTFSDNYGLNWASSEDFRQNYEQYGFRQVPWENRQPSDAVLIIGDDGVAKHTMMYDSDNAQGQPLFNHSNGGRDEFAIRKKAKYPHHNPYLTYEFIGTAADSTQWINQYHQLYGEQ